MIWDDKWNYSCCMNDGIPDSFLTRNAMGPNIREFQPRYFGLLPMLKSNFHHHHHVLLNANKIRRINVAYHSMIKSFTSCKNTQFYWNSTPALVPLFSDMQSLLNRLYENSVHSIFFFQSELSFIVLSVDVQIIIKSLWLLFSWL